MRSLRVRLVGAFALVVLATIVTLSFPVRETTVTKFARYVEDTGKVDQNVVSTLLKAYNVDRDPAELQSIVEKLARASGGRVIAVDSARRVVADSEHQLTGRPLPDPIPPVQAAGQKSSDAPWALFWKAATSAGSLPPPVLVVSVDPASGPAPPKDVAFTYVAAPGPTSLLLSKEAIFLGAFTRSLLVAGLLAGALAIALAVVLSARIVGPIQALTEAARRLQGGDFSHRVPVRGPDELGKLALAFNAMADGLARSERLRRTMVGDVAHDLRTPLTNVGGFLEALEDGIISATPAVVTSMMEEVLLLNRLIDDLQDLALAEAGQLRLDLAALDLRSELDVAATAVRPQAEAKGLCVRVLPTPEGLQVTADPARVHQVLRHLLSNALTHSSEGGVITLAARPGATPGEVEVEVRDTGAGIAPEHLPDVFERFYRADPSRTRSTGGTGLGLTIVKQLVEAHGGRVRIESALGQGTTVTFSLPRAGTGPAFALSA